MSEVRMNTGMVTPMHRYSAGITEEAMLLYLFLFLFFFPFLAFLSPPFVKFLTSQLNMSLSTLVGSLAVIFILVG